MRAAGHYRVRGLQRGVARGMGATVVYTNSETGYRAWDVPGWCSYTPFSSFMQTCQPPTPAQISETNMSNMGAAAANNPAVAQQIQAISNAPPTDPLYCQADPQGCTEYGQAINNPTISAIFGTGTVGQAVAGAANLLPSDASSIGWIGIVAIALVGVAALSLLGGRRRR